MTRTILVSFSAVLAFWFVPVRLPAADARPNIIFILCDDLGYGDLRCLNPEGKIATPNFDRVAREGMIFTDAHSGSAVCTPTRYGLMTGRYAWRSRLQQGVLGGLSPRLIEPERLTVAAFLKSQGYHTACFGKWHLGMDWVVREGKKVTELGIESPEQVGNVDYSRPIGNGPNTVGFDEYFGISASLDMVPYTFIENDHVAVLPSVDKEFAMMLGQPGKMTRKGPAAPDFEARDVLPTLTLKATRYIADRAADARSGRPFFLYLPLASPHTPIAPTPDWQKKSGLNPYADFVMQTDSCLGDLLAALDERGLAANTLVLIASDNGCSPEAGFDALRSKGHDPNGGLRGHKADIFEGGHRVPFLARWPAKVKPGPTSDRLTCLTDFFATCADIVGAKLPAGAAEDSTSFLPDLSGQAGLLGKTDPPARGAVVHHSSNGSFAIREGKWKLALCPGSGGWSAPRPGRDDASGLPLVQLYDLSTDRGERKNVQADHPEVVARLTALLDKYVANGRSTPGPAQQNAVPVDIWKAGKAAHQPLKERTSHAADDETKASRTLDGKTMQFPAKTMVQGGKATIGVVESCHDSMESSDPAADLMNVRKGDHIRLTFAKPVTITVLNDKFEVTEVIYSRGVFWVRFGDKVQRCTKYEHEKWKLFQAWFEQTL